ncbi:hypothetical protein [Piscinibacter sp. HJYY11]|uniref:hypothetical protein n=1 Tax=Piscinibacter sp. HJYY11 TaxID=2801333 RepID=UPI00191E14AC|nr:hypothetical protein [Piscinibacter sp. HJYY11]MBL0726233.1 hypothetical protein [Piscinibacter sp. HJYY11]
MSTQSSFEVPASSMPMELQAQAQAEADRFYGDGPAIPWHAGEAGDPRATWGWWVLGGALAIAVLATLVRFFEAGTDTATHAAPESPAGHAAVASPLGNPDEDLVDEPAPSSSPSAATVQTRPGHSHVAVTRQGREWQIEASGAARLLVAQRLADASGSSLRGDLAVLAAARPIDLNWRGRSTAQAWQAVLGPGLSFVTQCGGSRCRVWLLQGQEPGTAFPLPTRPPIPLPAVDVPATNTTLASASSRPSDSADPRVAAHHD